MPRPRTLVSVAVSLDGYIDDTSSHRLVLSSPADLRRVQQLRAEHDAVLVGANTVRRDNPSFLFDDPELRRTRVARGLPEDLHKVTLTSSGDLSAESRFFQLGTSDKFVYVPARGADALRKRLGPLATVVALPDGAVELSTVLADLHSRGIQRLFVEGGQKILTSFFAQDLVDELRLAVAPFFIGDSRAPRFVGDGNFPFHATSRLPLTDVSREGDMAILTYRR